MSDALLTRIAEALEKLVHHHTTGAAPAPAAAAAAEPTPAKKGRPAKTDAATSAQPAAASASAQPSTVAPATSVAAPAATPSADLVTETANAVIDLANNYSRDTAIAAMAKYGAQKVSQVKPADLAALLADVNAAIAAAKAAKANESLV